MPVAITHYLVNGEQWKASQTETPEGGKSLLPILALLVSVDTLPRVIMRVLLQGRSAAGVAAPWIMMDPLGYENTPDQGYSC